MKKLLCMILALIMVLSLCACGQQNPNSDQSNNGPSTNGQSNDEFLDGGFVEGTQEEPSYDEKEMMDQYKDITIILKNYADGEEIAYENGTEWVHGHAALEVIYNALSNMEELDKWYGSAWMPENDPQVNWNRQALLAGFAVHKDLLMKQECVITSKTGDVSNYENSCIWSYNADGTVSNVKWSKTVFANFIPYIYGFENEVFYGLVSAMGNETEGASFVYAEDGTLEQIKILGYIDDDNDNYHNGKTGTQILITLKRDENGKVVGGDWVEWQDHEGTITLAYDAKGKLTDATYTQVHNDTWWNDYCRTYSYDENGLKTVTHSGQETFKGEVKGRTYGSHTITENSAEKATVTLGWGPVRLDETTVTLEYDAQGRLVAATQGEGKMDEKNYSKAEFRYIYGDVYTYAPAK